MKTDPMTFGDVTRHQIDRWDVSEVVWDRRRVSQDTFQVSTDGRLRGGLFPWPAAGVVELPKGRWRRLGADVGRLWRAATTHFSGSSMALTGT